MKFQVGDRVYNKIYKDWGVIKEVDPKTAGNKPYRIQYDHGNLYWADSQEENLTTPTTTKTTKGGEKKMKFQKGDPVRINEKEGQLPATDPKAVNGHRYNCTQVGSEGVIESICGNEAIVAWHKLTGGSLPKTPVSFEVELQYLEKIEVPPLKIGDRVKVLRSPQNCRGTSRPSCCKEYIGKVGVITGFDHSRKGTVSVQKFPNTTRWCSGFAPDCLSLEEEKEGGEKMEHVFKVGDDVEVIKQSHGWGTPQVKPHDVGQVTTIHDDGILSVKFPNREDGWQGTAECFIPAKIPKRRRIKKQKVKRVDGKVIVERDFYPELKMCYDLNHYAVIVGETGTGKSFAVEYLARKLKVPFTRVSFDLATPIRELLGTLKLVREKDATITQFARGILLNAFLSPGIILGDELNSADPAKMFLLHQITDTRKIYIKEQGETFEMHPECRFFATINPSNRRYTGTLKLNLALVNRFHILSAPPFTREELNAIVPTFKYKTELLKFYYEIRKLITKQQPPFEFSVRNIQRIIDIYKAGMGLKSALEIGFLNQALCFGEKQEYDACVQIAMAVFGKEVMGASKR